jgi:hypothetical protein
MWVENVMEGRLASSSPRIAWAASKRVVWNERKAVSV